MDLGRHRDCRSPVEGRRHIPGGQEGSQKVETVTIAIVEGRAEKSTLCFMEPKWDGAQEEMVDTA